MLVNVLEGYEHVKDHNGRDHSSDLVKHARETGHLPVGTANFEVIGGGYRNNVRCRKIVVVLKIFFENIVSNIFNHKQTLDKLLLI